MIVPCFGSEAGHGDFFHFNLKNFWRRDIPPNLFILRVVKFCAWLMKLIKVDYQPLSTMLNIGRREV
jgi:hypothetical protein